MSDLIVITHRLDIPAGRQLAAQWPQARRVVVCPHLADRCEAEGLPVELLRLPGLEVPWDAYRQARADAQRLQGRLDEVLAVFDPMAPGCDWLQHDLFYTLYTLRGFASIWSRAVQLHPQATWHVPLPDLAFRYGCHSYLPALSLLERLGAAGRPLKAYGHALPPWDADRLPDLAALPHEQTVDLISHLPTCFYDHAHFEEALVASGQRVLNLRSQHYDVPVERLPSAPMAPLAQVRAALAPAVLDRIETVLVAAAEVLRAGLAPFIASPRYLAPQVQTLVDLLRRQMVFSASLATHFDHRPARTLVLSNHDTGLHGPLLSHARRHRSKVLLVPHSKIFNAPVPSSGLDIHCLTHPVQGVPVQNAQGRGVPMAALAFPEPMQWSARPPRRLKTLGVLLAGVSYSALCGADLDRYVRGLRQILDWCQTQGIVCRIRCKPSEPVIGLLTQGLGLPIERLLADMGGSLTDFANACDVCVSFDIPTSASVELLRLGVPTLHALVRPLLPEEAALMHTAIVPRALVADVLGQLEPLASDALLLWTFQREQFQAYARAWRDARPLAAFLQT